MTVVRAEVHFTIDGAPIGDPQRIDVDTSAPGTPRMAFLAALVNAGRQVLDDVPFELAQDDHADHESEPEIQGALP